MLLAEIGPPETGDFFLPGSMPRFGFTNNCVGKLLPWCLALRLVQWEHAARVER